MRQPDQPGQYRGRNPKTDVHDGQCAEIDRRVDLNILEDVFCHLPRTVSLEQQQHPALNIAMVNQVEDESDQKDQSFADHGRQNGEDHSYYIGRGQVDGALTLASAGHLRERIAYLIEECKWISQRLQALLEERTKFARPP